MPARRLLPSTVWGSVLVIVASVSVPHPLKAQNSPPACNAAANATPVAVTVHIADASQASRARAAVEVRCGGSVLNGISDEHGEVKFNLRPGHYTVLSRAPGFADTISAAELPAATGDFEVRVAVGSASDVINVTADTGFVPFASNAGSKTDAQLVEAPQSISIVNQQEMEARGVITVNEALR